MRQQLLVDDRIPYTSHNSSACLIVEVPDLSLLETIRERAVRHIEKESLTGSDPGLCIAWGDNGVFEPLMEFGRGCTERVVTQKDALKAAQGFHLSGHGGTNDGIIGAAAAVGLTASGWSGRFIEFARLRDFPDIVTVGELEGRGIFVVSMDRDAVSPQPKTGWTRRDGSGRAFWVTGRSYPCYLPAMVCGTLSGKSAARNPMGGNDHARKNFLP